MGNSKKKPQGFTIDKRSKNTRGIIAALWIAWGAMWVIVILLFVLIYNGVIGYMPKLEQLKNPQNKFATTLFTADGKEMGRYFSTDGKDDTGNRVYVDFDEISPHVIDALIATEDERFYDHSGIDVKALARVAVKTVMMRNRSAGGGSTITQQLAKQLYTDQGRGSRLLQKPIEWMIALKLERQYSKEEILKMYLNQFDFLNLARGIESASNIYFGKEAKDLSIEEAAMLVGMVQNPSRWNPRRNPDGTRGRRNIVLGQMKRAGMLTAAECDSLCALPLIIDYHPASHNEGIAPYFRMELKRYLQAKKPVRKNYMDWEGQKFIDDSISWETNPLYGWIEKNPKPDGSHWDLYNDGLRIYTTIDSRMQADAEQAVKEQMEYLYGKFVQEKKGTRNAPYSSTLTYDQRQSRINEAIRKSERYRVANKVNGKNWEQVLAEFNTPTEMTVFSYDGPIDTVMTPMDSLLYTKHYLRCGFMAMDPRNGYVKAYAGGPSFRFFQYDMVSTGRRQVGSTIKPFLYTLAMEEGMTPCTEFLNSQPHIYDENGRLWAPRNTGSARIGEMVDLRWALTNSNNWISARVMEKVQPHNLVRLMHNMGITNDLPSVISLALGPCEVSVREMVTAYSAFANGGMRSDPLYVTTICDNQGTVIATFQPSQTEVISRKAYYRILSVLLNVVDSGTGSRLRRAPYALTAQIGGKTGTTNGNSDAWFMGFTPEIVAGTWVGGEERDIHFNWGADGQGAAAALPIFGKFMSQVYEQGLIDKSARFTFPSDIDMCEGEVNFITSGDEEISVEGIYD